MAAGVLADMTPGASGPQTLGLVRQRLMLAAPRLAIAACDGTGPGQRGWVCALSGGRFRHSALGRREDGRGFGLEDEAGASGEAERMRKRYLYRHMVLTGRIRVPPEAAVGLIGPDCAYHLYSHARVAGSGREGRPSRFSPQGEDSHVFRA